MQQWLFGIVRNCARELWRSQQRDSEMRHRLSQEHVRAPADRVHDDADLRRIRSAMLELSGRDQQLLYWRYWERRP